MTALKPCPFCGGPAVLLGERGEGWNVTCAFDRKRPCFKPTAPLGWIRKADAVRLWNRRAAK